MKLAALIHLRELTRATYKAAGAIRQRLARNEAEIKGWDNRKATAEVWKVLRRGNGYGVTQALIETARAKAIGVAKALPLEDEYLTATLVIVNAIHDTAVDVLAALAAFQETAHGDPDEVAALVDEAKSADGLARTASFKDHRIHIAMLARGMFDVLLTGMEAALREQNMTREEAEKSLRVMVFEDKS
jgi:hypothetical protein